MNEAWTDRPKEVYKWIQNKYQPPLAMLLDPQTQTPTSNIPWMDQILHNSWDKVMRKYAVDPASPTNFRSKHCGFLKTSYHMVTTPLTGAGIAQHVKKMGLYTAMGLDGWCVADLLSLPLNCWTCLPNSYPSLKNLGQLGGGEGGRGAGGMHTPKLSQGK